MTIELKSASSVKTGKKFLEKRKNEKKGVEDKKKRKKKEAERN